MNLWVFNFYLFFFFSYLIILSSTLKLANFMQKIKVEKSESGKVSVL